MTNNEYLHLYMESESSSQKKSFNQDEGKEGMRHMNPAKQREALPHGHHNFLRNPLVPILTYWIITICIVSVNY